MPEKQIKSSNTPELTLIEKELLECAGDKIPVLLYGKDTIGRKELFLKTHELNGGICQSNELFLRNNTFDPWGEPVKILEPSPCKEKMEIRWGQRMGSHLD